MIDVQNQHHDPRNFEIQLGIYNLLLPLVRCGWRWDEWCHHRDRDGGESTTAIIAYGLHAV